jgi:hypothetical protein
MRKWRALLSIFGIVFLTFVIYSYKSGNQKEGEFPGMLFGIPTYQNSRLSESMSSLNGNPYIAVFLSEDSHEQVVEFYKTQLKMDYKLLEYGARNIVTMRIYQFRLEDGVIPDSINKGVEIIPFNARNRRVYNAACKIKIIIPKKDVLEAAQKQKNSTNEQTHN